MASILPVLGAVQALVEQPGAVELLARLVGMPHVNPTHAPPSRTLRPANTNMGKCTGSCERHCTSNSILKSTQPVITLLISFTFRQLIDQ